MRTVWTCQTLNRYNITLLNFIWMKNILTKLICLLIRVGKHINYYHFANILVQIYRRQRVIWQDSCTALYVVLKPVIIVQDVNIQLWARYSPCACHFRGMRGAVRRPILKKWKYWLFLYSSFDWSTYSFFFFYTQCFLYVAWILT